MTLTCLCCSMQFFAESPYPNIELTLSDLTFTTPADVSTNAPGVPANITDDYSPCVLPREAHNDGIFSVSLPRGTNDKLDATFCSPGGYLQVPCSCCSSACVCPCSCYCCCYRCLDTRAYLYLPDQQMIC